jgi:hypothetical protein
LKELLKFFKEIFLMMDCSRIIEESCDMKGAKKVDAVWVSFIGGNKISNLDGTTIVYNAKKVAPFFRREAYWRAF